MSDHDAPGPTDDATVEQTPGEATPAPDMPTGSGGGGSEREVGVQAAVERGPAELSDEGEPVHEDRHVSLEDREPARSTDEL